MKVRMLLMALAIWVVGALCAAAKSNVAADITMKDGAKYENVDLKLPKGWDDKVKFAAGDRQVVLDGNDVEHIVFWHKDAPERKALIKYMYTAKFKPKTNEIDTVPRKDEQWWHALEAAGKHLSYWIRFKQIKPSKKSISFEIVEYPYFFVKPEMPDRAFSIAYNSLKRSTTRDWLCGFLADDPAITKAISEKGYFDKKRKHNGNDYNPFFFEKIAEDYAPVGK